MPEKYTAQEIIKAFSTCNWQLNFDNFVAAILKKTPRYEDNWQEEKWANFQTVCDSILRMSEEHLQNILEHSTKE